ncbi:MAG: STAS/SEC14 domain-containing protein [Symploca sp. SIO1C2]|nr:STAS/SEC14 domain-containing protein [Symploca sp. SIO1C2]
MMISFIPIEQGNIIGIEIDGKIETSDIEQMIAVVEEKLKSHKPLRAYVQVKSLGGVSLEGLLEDLKFALRHLNDFEKKAVVCELSWLTKIATVSSKLFPSIEVKCFSWSEQEQAMAWIKN